MTDKIILELSQICDHTSWPQTSVRYNSFWRYKRLDNNIFDKASAAYILNDIYPYLEPHQQSIILTIVAKIKAQFAAYKNKDGRLTYNFYPTMPSKHFANGYIMRRFDHFRLPDDIDDTALIYLSSGINNEEIHELQNMLTKHQTSSEIYNTWFGKNMPHETDVCAALNMLLLVFKNGNIDVLSTKTLEYVISCIPKIEYDSAIISRHYAHPALVLYHYARFMSKVADSVLNNHKEKLISLAFKLFQNAENNGFKLLLSIALMKWGVKPNTLNVDQTSFNDYYNFIGAPMAPGFGTSKLSMHESSIIYWKSDFLKKTLLIEYQLLNAII